MSAHVGAYGLALPGLPAHRLVQAPAPWTVWSFAFRKGGLEPRNQEIDDDRAVVRVRPAGYAEINRLERKTTLLLPNEPGPEAIIHPYLAPTAALVARWLGRPSFHAGVFLAASGAWAVLGDREAGKSTALAWLAAHGVPIVSDDLCVLDEGLVLAGPRCLDLRTTTAREFGVGTDMGVLGTRRRWRVDLPDVPAENRFAGWITLQWAETVQVRRVRADRLGRLFDYRAVNLPEARPDRWLPLLAKPCLAFERPRDWARLDEAMAALLQAVNGWQAPGDGRAARPAAGGSPTAS